MPPITPPNACGASADPSRLAQQSLRAFWSWTPFAPLLGLKSPWLEIWGPQLRAFGVLSQGAYAPGMAFSGPKAPQVEEEASAEAAPKAAKPAPKAKAAKAPKAEAAPVAEAAPQAEAAPVAEAAPAKAEPKPKKAEKPLAKEPPKAAKDLFEDHEPAAPKAEPSLVETFSAQPEAEPEPAPLAQPEEVKADAAPEPAPAPEAAPAAPAQPEASALAADDLTLVEGVGPATARRLQEQGVRRYADLAALTPEALIEIRRVGTLTITEDQALGIISSAATLARPH